MDTSSFFPNFFNRLVEIIDSLGAKFYLVVFIKNKKSLFFIPLLVVALVFLINLNITKQYTSSATLIIEQEEKNQLVNIQDVYVSEYAESRMNNQIAILKSVELNQAIVENKNFNLISVYKDYYSNTDVPFFKRIFQKTFMVNNEFLANLLKQNLEIKNMPRSDVLNLSYTFEDPKVAQITLMALV